MHAASLSAEMYGEGEPVDGAATERVFDEEGEDGCLGGSGAGGYSVVAEDEGDEAGIDLYKGTEEGRR